MIEALAASRVRACRAGGVTLSPRQITKWVRRRAITFGDACSRTRRLSLRSKHSPLKQACGFELLPLRGGRRSRAREASNVEPVPFAVRELLSQWSMRGHFK